MYGVLSVAMLTIILTLIGIIKVPSLDLIISIRGSLLYMISLAGIIAVFAWNLGNRYLGPVNGILFMNIEPITAFIITAMTGYATTNAEIGGCVLTIIALLINNIYLRQKNAPPKIEK